MNRLLLLLVTLAGCGANGSPTQHELPPEVESRPLHVCAVPFVACLQSHDKEPQRSACDQCLKLCRTAERWPSDCPASMVKPPSQTGHECHWRGTELCCRRKGSGNPYTCYPQSP